MKTLEERFWEKVDKDGPVVKPELGPCWMWRGAKNKAGYGHIKRDETTVDSHRFSYELAFGQVPEGMSVLHRCDNSSCVRPNHLFLGTQQSNVDDMIKKGRARPTHGESNGSAKLTIIQVREIIRRESAGERQKDLAKKYHVDQSEISRIVNRKLWNNSP